jgi:hypothetical protein
MLTAPAYYHFVTIDNILVEAREALVAGKAPSKAANFDPCAINVIPLSACTNPININYYTHRLGDWAALLGRSSIGQLACDQTFEIVDGLGQPLP